MPLGLSLSLSGGSLDSAQAVEGNRVTPYANSHSLSFDGTDHAAVLSGTEIEALTRADFTWAFWIKDNSYSTASFGGFNDSNGTANDFYIRFLPVAPGVNFLQIYYKLNGIGSNAVISVGSSLTADTWHQIAVTVTLGAGASDTSTIKTYLNGSVISTVTNGPKKSDHSATSIESDQTWGIGARIEKSSSAAPSATDHTSSQIDEVAFWTTDLTAAEVTAIYNSGSGTLDLSEDSGNYASSSSLQHWFRLNNDLSDSTGNASDGSSQGSPSFTTNTPDS